MALLTTIPANMMSPRNTTTETFIPIQWVENTAHEGHRNGDHDNEGLPQGFELRRHDHVDQEHTQSERQIETRATPLPFLVLSGNEVALHPLFDAILEDAIHFIHCSPQRPASNIGLNQGDPIAIDAPDFAGAFSDTQAGDGIEEER